ncbi:hypothetical protein OIU78_012339 [Salix suchowensis]|nr:hypothetical protein OIU78_012339 [Salix suchowensis]
MRRNRLFCCRHQQLHPRLQERLMITCTLTPQTPCRGCTQTRAARSMWCRRNSRARCRVSLGGRNGGTQMPSIIIIITWMPRWIFHLRLSCRVGIRCRLSRIYLCTCRSRFEVGIGIEGQSHGNTRLESVSVLVRENSES